MSDQPNPPELSSEYHKARRNLTLSGGILLAWEYVGIELKKSVTLPLTGVTVDVRNPQVVPVVLSVLILFFSLRLFIEWKQSDTARRTQTFARSDIVLANFVGFLAIMIFSFQSVSDVDVATLVASGKQNVVEVIFSLGIFSIIGYVLGASFATRMNGEKEDTFWGTLVVFGVISFFVLQLIVKDFEAGTQNVFWQVGKVFLIVVGIFTSWLAYNRHRKTPTD